jgi:glycosyltransferase 2 family protein
VRLIALSSRVVGRCMRYRDRGDACRRDLSQLSGGAAGLVASDRARSSRKRFVRLAKVVVVVSLLAALALSARSQWGAVRHDLARLPVDDLVAAILLAILATSGSVLAWRAMLADLGSPLRLAPAVRVYSLSQLGKYVPGSVWPVLAQMELGRAYQVPRLRSATAFLLTLLGSVLTAVATGGLLAFTSPGWGRALALLPLVLFLLHPRLLVPLTRLLGRVLRRPALSQPPSIRGVARSVCWLLLQWLCLGTGTALMAHGLGASVSLTRCIAAVALSWAAGLAVIPVPAGAGVREGVLTFLLSSSVGSSRALALALLGRLTLTLADAVAAGVGVLVGRAARLRLLEGEAPLTMDLQAGNDGMLRPVDGGVAAVEGGVAKAPEADAPPPCSPG